MSETEASFPPFLTYQKERSLAASSYCFNMTLASARHNSVSSVVNAICTTWGCPVCAVSFVTSNISLYFGCDLTGYPEMWKASQNPPRLFPTDHSNGKSTDSLYCRSFRTVGLYSFVPIWTAMLPKAGWPAHPC